MKKQLLILLILFLKMTTVYSQVIDLTSGGAGTTTGVPQSFNETRGVDVTVLATPVHVTAMTLHRFCTGAVSDSGYVSARIYNSTTQALLYFHDSVVHPMYDDSVVIPVSYVLNAGQSYRISFSCYGFGNNHNSGSGYMYQPTFPYNDSGNKLQINSAHGGMVDSFPGNPNIFVPFISLQYGTASDVYNIEKEATLQISPNPFSSQTTLYSNELLDHATVRIFNLFGSVVKELNHLSGNSINLQRENLTAGVYFLQVIQKNKTIITTKIIIAD